MESLRRVLRRERLRSELYLKRITDYSEELTNNGSKGRYRRAVKRLLKKNQWLEPEWMVVNSGWFRCERKTAVKNKKSGWDLDFHLKVDLLIV